MKKLYSALAMFSMALTAHAATAPPKVVFIGDWITYNWTSGFAANPNWINKGVLGLTVNGGGPGSSSWVLAQFQADVVSLHPAIVHIMIGEGDSTLAGDASFQFLIPDFLTNLNAIVQEARAANIKVILGIEPTILGGRPAINSVIASFAAANNIPMINYGDALCGCVGSVTPDSGIGSDLFNLYGGGPFVVAAPPNPLPFPESYPLVVTSAGYAMMTQMAKNAITTMNLTLTTGWLQNVQQYDQHLDNGPIPNVNSVSPGAVIQFTPVGYYSDGSQHKLLNTNFQGSSGTWTSSNPLVVYVSQTGLAWAISQGTATIRYVSPSGVKFSSWVMTVFPPWS